MEQHPPTSSGGEREPLHAETLRPDTPENVVAGLALAVPVEAAAREANKPIGDRRTSKEILAVAKASIEAVAAQVRENENAPGVRELAEHMISSDDMQAPPHLLARATDGGRLDIREVMATVTDCSIFQLWSRSKVVYAMDDLLLGYLSEASSSPIPTQILQQLPHPDPCINGLHRDDHDIWNVRTSQYGHREPSCASADRVAQLKAVLD